MKVPKKVDIILGSALTIWYLPPKFRRASQIDFFYHRHALAINSMRTILFALPKKNSKNDREKTKFILPSVDLKMIGRATQIMWRWNEIDETLLHKWEKEKPKIYADRMTDPRVVAIKHSRGIIFNKEGII